MQNLCVLDGVLVYFNKDKPHGVDNCLKLRDGLVCKLRTDRCAYELKFTPRAAVAAVSAADSVLPDIAVPDAFFDRRTRDVLRVHAALGHVGANTINISNVTLSGIRPAGLKEPHLCTGCRLSARRPAAAGGVRALCGPAAPDVRRTAAEYFGQEVSSDCCSAMPLSSLHKFTLLLNSCESYSKEKAVFFTIGKSHTEIGSALRAYCRERVDHLKNGKIGTWKTENGKEFCGDEINGKHGAARELAIGRVYSIP